MRCSIYFYEMMEKRAASAHEAKPMAKRDVPEKVKEIYYAIKRDNQNVPKETAARIAWDRARKKPVGPPYDGPLSGYTGGKRSIIPKKYK